MSQSNKFSNIDCSGLLKNEGSTQAIEIKDFMTIKFGSSVVLNDYITLNAEISSHIGYLKLDGSIDYILKMECSRCLELDKQHNSSNISAVFTNDNEDDALVIQENKSLNLDGLIADIITESLDMKYICFEDCDNDYDISLSVRGFSILFLYLVWSRKVANTSLNIFIRDELIIYR